MFGDSYTKNRDRLFFFVAYRGAAPAGRLRVALHAHLLAGDAQRRLQRAARQSRLEPEQHPAAADSPGAPRRRPARRRTTTCGPTSRRPASISPSLYPLPNYSDPNNLYNYVYSALEPNNRYDFKVALRLEHQQQHQGLRPRRPRRGDGDEPARRVVGARRTSSRCPRRTSARTAAAPIAANVVSVLSPSMTNEVAGQLQPADARQPLRGSRACCSRAPAASRSTASSRPAQTSPYLPTDLLHGWGSSGQVGNLWAKANDVYAYNDTLQFSNKLTKLLGIARPEVRHHGRARPEAAELPEPRSRPALVRHRQHHRHRQLRRRHAGRAGSVSSARAPRAPATPRRASRSASSATGTSTRSRRTAGSCART